MGEPGIILIFLAALFIIEILYFKVAERYKIYDMPNHRSSHTVITLRGGGIIFPIGFLLFQLVFGFTYPWFTAGLLLLAVVSFIDDLYTLNSKLRFLVQLISALLLVVQLNLLAFNWLWLLPVIIVITGVINAYNFMDGINGITGVYSLTAICTLLYINYNLTEFTSNLGLMVTGASLLVFLFFNFRLRAKCFAGDVGSVSIALIILLYIGLLITKTHNLWYILLLFVYGIDTGITIVFRKARGEKIFDAHRSHFYQYLVNERKMGHRSVAVLYALAQVIVNVVLIYAIQRNESLYVLIMVCVILTAYIIIRMRMEGRHRLLKEY